MSIERKLASVVVGAMLLTACNELPPWLSNSSNGRLIETECRGLMHFGEIRSELEQAPGYWNRPPLTWQQEIEAFNDATCGMSDLPIHTPSLSPNRLVICKTPLTVRELYDRLSIAGWDGGESRGWKGRTSIAKFKEIAESCKPPVTV